MPAGAGSFANSAPRGFEPISPVSKAVGSWTSNLIPLDDVFDQVFKDIGSKRGFRLQPRRCVRSERWQSAGPPVTPDDQGNSG
jgi:hypothetical protein